MSGPVAEYCVKCEGHVMKYLIPQYNKHTMDSITLAKMVGAGHEPARSNRTQAWLTTPTQFTTCDYYVQAVNRNKTLNEDEKKALRCRFYDELPNW